MWDVFYLKRPRYFGELPNSLFRKLLKNEIGNGMFMEGLGKGKLLEWDWGKGKWYNGEWGRDTYRVGRFQKYLNEGILI